MTKIPMTADGYARLEEELKHLKAVARPEVIRAISEAREHGDISENAEYLAARERQSFIEGRLAELEDKISRAEVIDPATLSGKQVTRFESAFPLLTKRRKALNQGRGEPMGMQDGKVAHNGCTHSVPVSSVRVPHLQSG